MQINIDQTRWYDRVWAAMIFFTRLPLWRVHQPPRECYKAVVEHWPLAGWITGGVMALVLYLGGTLWPQAYALVVVAAIAARVLTTGALHEDGLADFLDGFGGGAGSRERTLDIMKDSHIGTYGVLGLALYLMMLAAALYTLPPQTAALTALAADPYAKMLTAQMVMMMPYARRADEAKSGVVYRKMGTAAALGLALEGLLPMGLYVWLSGAVRWDVVIFLPALVMYALYLIIWRRLRGYTGDCCGAVCLLTELAVYLVVALNS